MKNRMKMMMLLQVVVWNEIYINNI